jgi:hypothetical protein
MRCPDCNKFVAFDEMEAQEDDVSITPGVVSVAVRGVLCCAECGSELKETTFDLDLDFEHDCDGADETPCAHCGHAKVAHSHGIGRCETELSEDDVCKCKEFELPAIKWDQADNSLDFTPTDRYEDRDRHGKLIKNYRYMKHFYGVEVTGTLTCPVCGEDIDYGGEAEEQASAFDELV